MCNTSQCWRHDDRSEARVRQTTWYHLHVQIGVDRNLPWRALLRPKGPKFKVEGWQQGRSSSGGPPPHQLAGLGECCKLPQRGSGWSPDRKCILDALRAQKRVLWWQMPCQPWILGRGDRPSSPSLAMPMMHIAQSPTLCTTTWMSVCLSVKITCRNQQTTHK